MQQARGATGPAVRTWWRRENLLPGLALLLLAALAWVYTLSQASTMAHMAPPAPADTSLPSTATGMPHMGGMDMPAHALERPAVVQPATGTLQPGGLLLFLAGWAVMMVAMMLPAALPLVLLYRTIARKRLPAGQATAGMIALLAGYVGIWTVAGLPVYGYSLLAARAGPLFGVLPGLLLIGGGVYQFTALKQGCHARCRSPLFFLMNHWRPGAGGALRMGLLHGIDCLGCCLGLMAALVALGMMNVAWMLTAALIIFGEKTLPGGHRIARPLGVALSIGGAALIIASVAV